MTDRHEQLATEWMLAQAYAAISHAADAVLATRGA